MSLSKKHYIAITDIIRNNYESTNDKGEYEPSINTKIISDLATYFRNENIDRLNRVKGARYTFDVHKFVGTGVRFTTMKPLILLQQDFTG